MVAGHLADTVIPSKLRSLRQMLFVALAGFILVSALHYHALHIHAGPAGLQVAEHVPGDIPSAPDSEALIEPVTSEVHNHPAGMPAGTGVPLALSATRLVWVLLQSARKGCLCGVPERPPRFVV